MLPKDNPLKIERRRLLQLSGVLLGVTSAGCTAILDNSDSADPEESEESDDDNMNDIPITAAIDVQVDDDEVTITVIDSGTASYFVLQGGIDGVDEYEEGDHILDGGSGSQWTSSLSGSGSVDILGVNDDRETLIHSLSY